MTVLGQSTVDREFLEFLFSRAAGLGVTEDILKSIRSSYVLEILLQQQSICKITPSILEPQSSWQCIKLLLEHETQLVPTTAVVINVLQASDLDRESDALEELWKRNPDLKVTNDVLKVTSQPKHMEFLLERHDPDTRISDEVLAAVLESPFRSTELLRLLLHHDKELQVPSDLILESLDPYGSVDIFEVALEHDPAMSVTEEMLLKVFGSDFCSEEEMQKMVGLMQRYGKTVVVTKAVRAQVLSGCQSQSQTGLRELISSLMV
ncbi:hypothetical protein BDV97DRAFT_400964 [Delphinella strobiligena]|nr:hypothetical protein BDV97DRAFT_400964 [Delphinella strobiligena]